MQAEAKRNFLPDFFEI